MHEYLHALICAERNTHFFFFFFFFCPKGMFLELISVIECMLYCLVLDRE